MTDASRIPLARWRRTSTVPRLGVVMIVKDEAHNLPDLFASIADVADEVVVVDTGSTDDTVAICEAWGARVVSDPWRDDFSRARNRSIAESRADYLLWLDGDDRLPPRTRAELAKLRDTVLPGSPARAFQLQVHSLDADGRPFGRLGGVFSQTRIFPRRPGVAFRNAVHEEVNASLAERSIERVATDWVVEHVGYSDPEVRRAKAVRNEALLRGQLQREPGSVSTLLHMAMTLKALERDREAEEHLTRALDGLRGRGGSPRLRAELHVHRSDYRVQGGDLAGARSDLRAAAQLWPGWRVPTVALAGLLLDEGDADGADALLARARQGRFHAGTLGFAAAVTERNLELFAAAVHRSRGQHEAAASCLERALALDPADGDVRLLLGQTLLDLESFAPARAALEPLGEEDASLERFVDVAAAIALARAGSGDLEGASACLAPLLDVFAEALDGADDVGPIELAGAMLDAGYGSAARNLVALVQRTMLAA